jgi:hypothetical protein
VASRTAKHFATAAERARNKRMLRTLVEVAVDPYGLDDATTSDGIHVEGDDRLRRIFTLLDSFGFERSEFQKLWHWFMVGAALPHIYGERDWPRVQQRVLKSMGFTELRSEVLIQTFRRAGKTWSVSMLVAALLLCVPGLRISVISTSGRASGKLMEEVMRFLYRVRGGVSRICGYTHEKLYIAEHPLPRGASMRSPVARLAQTASGTSFLEVLPNNPTCMFFLSLSVSLSVCVCVFERGERERTKRLHTPGKRPTAYTLLHTHTHRCCCCCLPWRRHPAFPEPRSRPFSPWWKKPVTASAAVRIAW